MSDQRPTGMVRLTIIEANTPVNPTIEMGLWVFNIVPTFEGGTWVAIRKTTSYVVVELVPGFYLTNAYRENADGDVMGAIVRTEFTVVEGDGEQNVELS